MKKLYSLLMIMALVLTVSSCKDSKPNDLPVTQEATATKTIKLGTTQPAEMTVDMSFDKSDFAALEKYAKWVTSGRVQASSYMEFTNIDGNDVEISNVKLYLASSPKVVLNLGKVDSDVKFNELEQLEFMESVINEVAKRGSSTVKIYFETKEPIEKPINFTVKLYGKFSF